VGGAATVQQDVLVKCGVASLQAWLVGAQGHGVTVIVFQ
jgi:hypothetical protein